MITDPISNRLTIIRNAIIAADSSKHRVVSIVPSSKQLDKIADILQKKDFIEKCRVTRENPGKPKLELLLVHTGKSPILGSKRIYLRQD